MACEQKHPLNDSITMYKRKDDDRAPWQYRFYVSSQMNNGGKPFDCRKSTGKLDFKEACTAATVAYQDYTSTVECGDQVTLSGKPTVNDGFKEAERLYRSRIAMGKYSADSLKSTQKYYYRDIEPHFGKTPVEKINPRMWADFMSHIQRKKPGIAQRTLKYMLTAINAALDGAIHAQFISFKPRLSVHLIGKASKKGAESERKRVWFNAMQQYRLLLALDNRVEDRRENDPQRVKHAESLRDFTQFMLFTGMRVGEMKSIRFCDIQMDRSRDRSASTATKKLVRKSTLEISVRESKTGYRKFTIQDERACEAFERTLIRRGAKKNSKDKLFDKDNLSSFRQVLKDIGLYETDVKTDQGRPIFHDRVSLRHSFICNQILEGEKSLYQIGKICGNSETIIQTRYSEFLQDIDYAKYRKDKRLLEDWYRKKVEFDADWG